MRIRFREEQTELRVSFRGGGGQPTTTFSVTPSREAQTVTPPAGFVFSGGTVAAIPNNYGLITYSGFELRVS